MKTPVEWDNVHELAVELADTISNAHFDGDCDVNVAYTEGRNGYDERGTMEMRSPDGRVFQLSIYEVRE